MWGSQTIHSLTRVKRDNNDKVGLNDVIVAQPSTVEQNELIAQLMQQIVELRAEYKKKQDFPNLGITTIIQRDGNIPLYFAPLCSREEHFTNPHSNLIHDPSTIDLPSHNFHHASISYQVPPYP